MKIRNRITLWITGAGLIAGLLSSVVIFYEMLEQPYGLLDAELDSQAHTLLRGFMPARGTLVPLADRAMLDSLGMVYWLKIYDRQHRAVYTSSLAQFADLPLRIQHDGYNVSATIPREAASLEQDDSDEVTFRVRVFSIPLANEEYIIQIARPMEKLQEEISDLLISIGIGLILYSILLIFLGYFAAGRILKPITDINALAREISDKTLDKRIPLGTNQDEIHALSSSLNKMFDRLQNSFERQKEFITNAAHELKTPIAMQRLFLGEALQRRDLPPDFMARLNCQSEILLRMERLVKNLLDLSALQRQETCELTQIDLARLLSTLLAEFKEIFQAKGIDLRVDLEDPVRLSGDEDKLRRMLINLIDNAIRYNREEDGEIRINLKVKNQKVLFEIYNSGKGIPDAELDRVFEQFYRVEKSRSSSSGGSGLGLTIVRRIVELHHGHISITSEQDSWTRIQIILPGA